MTAIDNGMYNWIVVVDDEALSLKNARTLLTSEKMRVSCLLSGRQLLKFMEKNTPNLILMDVMMPGMDGFETFEALRRLEKEMGRMETPVIFLTGESDEEMEKKGLEMGAYDFIYKPFNKEILLGRINNAILNIKKIESLTEDATIDKLTGFLNKTSGIQRISDMCARMTGALMVFDIDNFKLVNDLFRHEMGDKALSAFADVVRKNVRSRDVVSRIGGDEFMAFFGNVTEQKEAEALTKRFNDEFEAEAARLMGPEHGIPLGISIGVVMVPEYGREYDVLFPLADEALYIAKKNGKHRCAVYSSVNLKDEGTDDPEKALSQISQIMQERSDGGGAMILGPDAFSEIYHFVMRFIKRYDGTAMRILFMLKPIHEVSDNEFKNLTAGFSEVLKWTLRRSDFILQNKSNQFFVLLPMIEESDAEKVIDRIKSRWERDENHNLIEIVYAKEMC